MKLFVSVLIGMMFGCVVFAQDAPVATVDVAEKQASVFVTTPPAAIAVGATYVASVWLTVRSGEVTAFSGSVSFDPAALKYIGFYLAVPGVGNAINAEHVVTGKFGYAFIVQPGAVPFPQGTTWIFSIYFQVLPTGAQSLGLFDIPILREVVDASAINVSSDHTVIVTPTVAMFFAGPYWSFGPLVTIGVERSSYPVAVWRIDHDGSHVRVPDSACVMLPFNGKKCTDSPKGGGRVLYYLEWDAGVGKLRSPTISVQR